MTRGPRPGDLPAGATWDDGRCDERTREPLVPRAMMDYLTERFGTVSTWATGEPIGYAPDERTDYGADERTNPAPLAYLSPVVEEVARLRVEVMDATARAEAAEGERDALRAQVAAVEDCASHRTAQHWPFVHVDDITAALATGESQR